MNSYETTASFYDDFSEKQVKTGKNLRHYILAKKLKQKGIARAKNILEIGCGIGTLTELIIRIAPNAEVTALDISPRNIEIATKRVRSRQTRFLVADASDSIDINKKFDFIILPDVIEHIPIEHYGKLFSNLKSFSHSNTKIFINIPHPDLIKYLRETNPKSLQVIDQSVYPTILYQHLIENNFIIDEKRDYSIFYQTPDYSYYWLRPHTETTYSYNQKIALPIRIVKKFIIRFL